jgi:Mn-containing catalase
MYFLEKRLQYPVRVEKPDPIFARQLQQAIGGVEGEIRVCLQYFFQAWGARGPGKISGCPPQHRHGRDQPHRDARHRGGDESGECASDPAGERGRKSGCRRGDGWRATSACCRRHAAPAHAFDRHGAIPRQLRRRSVRLFACLRQRQSGRRHVLQRRGGEHRPDPRRAALQRHQDPGMQNMLSYLIARDTMHQQQWLAIIEELGRHASAANSEQLRPVAGEARVQLYLHGERTRRRSTSRTGASPPARRSTAGPSSASCKTSRWARFRSWGRPVRDRARSPFRSQTRHWCDLTRHEPTRRRSCRGIGLWDGRRRRAAPGRSDWRLQPAEAWLG